MTLGNLISVNSVSFSHRKILIIDKGKMAQFDNHSHFLFSQIFRTLTDRHVLTRTFILHAAEWNEATFDSGQNAFSVEYDIINNDYRMLHLESNTFCSAGGFLKNGTFISTGGGERQGGKWKAVAGWQSIRYFTPCNDGTCEWEEYVTSKTSLNRWYPTVEQLPEVDILRTMITDNYLCSSKDCLLRRAIL
jgi:hypothetical protein